MQIIINGKSHPLSNGQSLQSLLEGHESYSHWCAVAVNGHFIPKQRYETTYLKAGDTIEVLQPAQGG